MVLKQWRTLQKTLLIFAIVAASVLVSCQGQIEPSSQKKGNDGTKVFTASIDNVLTRTTLGSATDDPATYPVNWAKDDLISINGKAYKATTGGSSTSSFAVVDGDATENSSSPYYEAYYPSSIYNGGTPTLPSTVTYDAEASYLPMYAATTEKGSTSLSFKNICAVLAVTVKKADFSPVKSIRVSSSNCALSGAFTVSDGKAVLTEASTVANTVTLNCATAVNTATDGTVFYIAIPAQTYRNLKIELSVDGSNYTKSMTTKDANIDVAVNTVYPITFKSVLLPGEFSVSKEKKVQFTNGNLWCNTTTNPVEWHLESAQNVTYATLGQSSYTASHVCLFYWTKTAAASYAESYSDGTCTTSDVPFFAESKGGLTVDGQSGLYVLSDDEWKYLFGTRTNASSLYKSDVTVSNGGTDYTTNCLIIAPDNYSGTALNDITDWSLSNINSLGLVCLPAAGNRDGSSLYYAGSYGDYWSATPYGSDKDNAYILDFCDSDLYPSCIDFRSIGRSVRLVCLVSE